MNAHTMKKRFSRLPLLAGLLLVLCIALLSSSALAEDPLQVEREITPRSLTGPTTVNVAINVINISDDAAPVTVTLHDPNGNVCSGFGSGGTANLTPGASAAYSGSWTVSESQLTSGRITYVARYRITNEDGTTSSVSKPIALNFTYEDVNPSIRVQRSAASKVPEGTTTQVVYTVINTGTVNVLNVKISDPGIGEPVSIENIPVGESREAKFEFVMGAESVTSEPTITWEYMVGNTVRQGETKRGDAKVIEVATVNLLVSLKANSLIVNPGDKVELTCTLENRGDETYEQIQIYDDLLGNVESGLSLGAGKTETIVREITVPEAQTYCFKVSAVSGSGENVVFQSNNLTIQTLEGVNTTDDSIGTGPVGTANLEIIIEGDRQVIYEKPSDIIFQVKVINRGEAPVENIEIRAASKRVTTIDRLEAGEEYDFTRQFRASMEGEYQFSAVVDVPGGEDQVFTSNTYPVTYHILSTPAPTVPPIAPPTEAPTETPVETPTAPPFGVAEPEDEGLTLGSILLYILGVLLVLILLAVVLLFVMDRRRNAPPPAGGGGNRQSNVVIDSIQRSPHRDYARAPKRGPAPKRESKPPVRKDIMPAYAPDEDEREDYDAPAERSPYDAYDAQPSELGGYQGAESQDTYAASDAYRAQRTYVGRQDDFEDIAREENTPPLRIHDLEPRRPVQPALDEEEDDVKPYRRPSAESADVQKQPSFEKTAVYHRDFISRVREAEEKQEEVQKHEDKIKKLSDEDAALLSGSTGMYRLSRKSASVRSNRPFAELEEKAENAESFARRQRAARARRPEVAAFYEDDDDGEDGEEMDETPRRRRR